MMKNKKIKLLILFLIPAVWQECYSFLPMNLLDAFDPNLVPLRRKGEKLKFTFNGSTCFSIKGQNALGQIVNPLQKDFETQDALAMLKGFAPGTEQAQLGQLINIDDDNGIRGHFKVTGDVKIPFYGNLVLFAYFKHGIWLGVALPFMSAKINNVVWEDQTQNNTLDDALTHEYVTNNVAQTVFALGDGLLIGNWSKTGIGDLEIVSGWSGSFLQEKEWLKKVSVGAWIGVLFPTGYKREINYAVAFDFGTGGAFAIPFGADLGLCFKEQFWLGVDFVFLKTFNHSRPERIATNAAQTELLLLQVTPVRRKMGFIQKYNLYFEPIIYKGFSFRFSYEHIKASETKLYVLDETLVTQAVNTSLHLQETTINDLIFQAKFNFDTGPQAMIYGKMPTGGKRSLQIPLVGIQMNIDF